MPSAVKAGMQTQTAVIPFGNWKPDVPTPMNDGMPFSLNLVPKANGFYGPEKALAVVGDNQSTTPFGAALKAHGSLHSRPPAPGENPQYYVGTFAVSDGASKLLQREESGAWQDVSRIGGYNVTASNQWRFANFGNKVLAVNRGNTIQISDGGDGDVFANVNADLRGADIATVRGFAVTINIVDSEYGEGAQPYRVWWSAIADANNWPDPISDEAINTQSGFFDLFGGGRLRRIIPGIGGTDAIIISDRKMWRMRYVGPAQIFEFDEVETDQGTSAAGSIAQWNESFFFFGHSKFYFFDGANSTPIGVGEMDEFFLNDIDLSSTFGRQNAIEAAIDSENKTYCVSYRSVDAAGDNNDKMLRYNWITGAWSVSEIAADTLGHVDSFRSSTDSPRLVAIDTDFQIKAATGATLEAILESREITHDNGAYYAVQGVLPYIDTDSALATIRFRDTQGQDLVDSDEVSQEKDGYFRWRNPVISGRFYRCRLRVPAGTNWTSATAVVYEYREHATGTRLVA